MKNELINPKIKRDLWHTIMLSSLIFVISIVILATTILFDPINLAKLNIYAQATPLFLGFIFILILLIKFFELNKSHNEMKKWFWKIILISIILLVLIAIFFMISTFIFPSISTYLSSKPSEDQIRNLQQKLKVLKLAIIVLDSIVALQISSLLISSILVLKKPQLGLK
ncbi:Uncharacterised protein [Metamycoplasma arthritidis]|uniref:Uncharacterized protein n=1 Tax=Metamycoplasma arthritidis (strain 158L3-1) TaxID=243272 RepID=B3PM33_META1|nr:hypothetical protein [Metamycoplasma arthritidis]ACF07085.1 hypothetical protein MARTH_orf156 [Metamycoplasma arthritidis 158L3-1]VEU78613.1 Uncharacterised protein [Metamycoplasma arthritidis]